MTEFPRIPMPRKPGLFRELCSLGADLIDLHLMESTAMQDGSVTYVGPEEPRVLRVQWSDETVWLDAPATGNVGPAHHGTMGFHGVDRSTWELHVGGYPVCYKWLKDRKGRALSRDDIAHYQRIVSTLAETIRLMASIHGVIEQHGGWPDAFASE
jgi:hypothetical protein